MDEIKTRRVMMDDVDELQQISHKTFNETFSGYNTSENMAKYLEEGLSIERLTDELSNEHAEFYFALDNNITVGYLKLNAGPSQTELQDNNALEIERIYVLQAYQGKKIGQLLYEKAMEVAKQKNVHYIWLGVWEENHKAINFYQKNGFAQFDKHMFKLGDDEQTDIMMKKTLV